jgi:hypothetical protein
MWTEIPKGKNKKPVNKDRFISKMFLRSVSFFFMYVLAVDVILVVIQLFLVSSYAIPSYWYLNISFPVLRNQA